MKDSCYHKACTVIPDEDRGRFFGKTVVVTGASSGIGKYVAIEFAKQDAEVVIAARNAEKLNEVKKIILKNNGDVIDVIADVSVKEDCKKIIDKAVEQYGKIDILINNAGISMRAKFEELDVSVIERLMAVNFFGTVYCTKYALPYIKEQKGSVVGVSSVAGFAPLPGRTGYSASKFAMDGFLKTLRMECKKDKVHVMIIHPGFTESNIRYTALNAEGKSQAESPRDEKKMMSAQKVAESLTDGVYARQRSIVLTRQGKILAWLYKRFPVVAEWFIEREVRGEG